MEIVIKNRQRLIKINRRKIERALRKAIDFVAAGGRQPVSRISRNVLSTGGFELSVLFVNDKKMRELNLGYRGIDKSTDVLSFPQISLKGRKSCKLHVGSAISGHPVQLGDIVINLHKAKRQAREHGVGFSHEVMWLLMHGLLHLVGYDHEVNSYEAREMRKMEAKLLEAACR